MRWYVRASKLEITDITEEGLSVKKDVSAEDVDQDELEMGRKVELEHTDKKELAEKISLDHLAEIPDYYTRLKKMEDEAKAEGKKASVVVIVKVADFQPPKSRRPISITWKSPGMAADPYYLIGDVNSGRDARGNITWDAPGSRGKGGEPKTIHSSDVQSWRPYSGPLYDWHEAENKRDEQARYERENKAKIEAFREANKFQDGRPLNPNMFLTVSENAPGDLGMFAGRRLRVESINYDAGTVSLKPFGWEEPEFEQFLGSIPVADVLSGTSPSMARGVESTPIRLQDGKVVEERDLPALTPHFRQALENGQVMATVRVYGNYESKGMTGERRYLHDMAERGYEPGEGGYALDATPKKYNPDGSPANLFGPYSAHIKISAPVSQELIEEVKALAPASTVKGGPQGLVLDSKPLFMLMIDSGHHDKVGVQRGEEGTDVAASSRGPAKLAWYSYWTPEDERDDDPDPDTIVTMDDILSVGKIAVQNGYYNVSSSSKSKSMYYARGPRPPGKGHAPTEVTLRVSDHEPTYMQSAEAVNIILYKDQPPPQAGNSIYAKAGDIESMQEAFRKADAEIRSRSGSSLSSVASWISGNCRFA